MKRKGSKCVGILSDWGEAATASNLSEYTLTLYLLKHCPDNLLLGTDQGVTIKMEVHDANVHSLAIHLPTCGK